MIDIQTSEEKDYQLIMVNGEVDASSSIELDNALEHAINKSTGILVDLSGLEYISSAGLGVFISHLEDVKIKQIKLVLTGMKPKVYEVFQILGLQNLMNIKTTKEEGLALINEA